MVFSFLCEYSVKWDLVKKAMIQDATNEGHKVFSDYI